MYDSYEKENEVEKLKGGCCEDHARVVGQRDEKRGEGVAGRLKASHLLTPPWLEVSLGLSFLTILWRHSSGICSVDDARVFDVACGPPLHSSFEFV